MNTKIFYRVRPLDVVLQRQVETAQRIRAELDQNTKHFRKLLRHLALSAHGYAPDCCATCAKIADELTQE